MSLRSRLLAAAGVILLVVVAGRLLIIRSQESYLIGQIDDQLGETRPFFRPVPSNGSTTVRPTPPEGEGVQGPVPEAPVSRLYAARVVDGEIETVLRGQLLDDVPAIEVDELVRDGDQLRGPRTVDGSEGKTRFRVAVQADPLTGETVLIGLPLDEVDEAVDRLRVVLLGGGIAIATVLVIGAWSVERLGLRPVARVTEVADAIANGARGLRVEDSGKGTEADRLAVAFNVMLDEREETERQLRRFISDASHELRTPLTSIRGYLDLYRSGGFKGEGEMDDVVRRLGREARRMNDLVEDLLLLARFDEQPVMRFDPVDLGVLLEDAATDARVLQPERPLHVEVDGAPVTVVGDAHRLQQVIGVLVSNALAHTPNTADLRLESRRLGDGARITISDDGPGLVAEVAEHVFDRFYRGDTSRARRTGGAGLGLAIARSIVEAHGGTITLTTAPGEGCTFDIDLPSVPPTADRSVPA